MTVRKAARAPFPGFQEWLQQSAYPQKAMTLKDLADSMQSGKVPVSPLVLISEDQLVEAYVNAKAAHQYRLSEARRGLVLAGVRGDGTKKVKERAHRWKRMAERLANDSWSGKLGPEKGNYTNHQMAVFIRSDLSARGYRTPGVGTIQNAIKGVKKRSLRKREQG